MKKKYILIKESPELKRGAILEEECDGRDQGFECINSDIHHKHKDQNTTYYSRNTVMKSPEWFKEIKLIEVPINHIKKVETFIKTLK